MQVLLGSRKVSKGLYQGGFLVASFLTTNLQGSFLISLHTEASANWGGRSVEAIAD